MDTEDVASRVEEWSSQFQEVMDRDKATIDAVNMFMAVVWNQCIVKWIFDDICDVD